MNSPKNERNSRREMHGVVLAPEVVLPQVPSVITPYDHNRVVGKFQPLQFRQHISHELIHVTHAGQVTMPHHAVPSVRVHLEIGQVVGLKLPAAAQLTGRLLGTELIVGDYDFLTIIQIPVLFGRVEWHVRFNESACQEKRRARFLQTLQVRNGLFGHFAVPVGIVRDIR